MNYKIIKSIKGGEIFPVFFPSFIEDVKLIGAFEVLSSGSLAVNPRLSDEGELGIGIVCLGSDRALVDSEFIKASFFLSQSESSRKEAQAKYEAFNGRMYAIGKKIVGGKFGMLHGPFSEFKDVIAIGGEKGHHILRFEKGLITPIRRWDMGTWRKLPLKIK